MIFHFVAVLLSYVTPPPTLDNCVRYWQKEMHLRDWTITLQVVNAQQLDPWHLGDIEPHRDTKTAILRVMREQDSTLPRRLALSEQRLTIIHEMVHLRKLATGDGDWRSEIETDVETGRWVRRHRRWREALAIEQYHAAATP